MQRQLAQHSPVYQDNRAQRKRSAVAIVLQQREGEPHVLMIKRAENENDPWSGHMAFPGGRLDPTDAHSFAAAVRETKEELGVVIDERDSCWGRLSEPSVARPGRPDDMFVTPYVFYVQRELSFTPNYEVADVVWIPLSFLLDASNRSALDFDRAGEHFELPCYYWRDVYCVWGLSLLMLDEMMDLIEGKNPLRPDWRRMPPASKTNTSHR